MEALKTQLGQVDDDYLTGLCNKGIVKRAYKDLEKETPVLTWQEEEASVALKEETCVIRVPLGESTCSCPSRSICRHIVTAILWLKQKTAREMQDGGQPEEEGKAEESKEAAGSLELPEENQGVLGEEALSIPPEKLKKACGNKRFRRFLAYVQSGEIPEVEETSVVTVRLPWEKETVKLLKPLAYSTCTCHSKELCAHKAQALLLYQMKRGSLTIKVLEALLEENISFDREQADQAVESVRQALLLQLCAGLSRQSMEVTESLERLAVISHRAALADLETAIRSIAGEYQAYFERSAAFEEEPLLGRILSAYERTEDLSRAKEPEEFMGLAGNFRDSYEPVGNLHLVGLGVRSFSSKTGYEGEIYYFLETRRQEYYTWTDARPVFYEGVSKRRPNAEDAAAPWGLSCSWEQLTSLAFELKNAKAAFGGRLSVSRETLGEITGARDLGEDAIRGLIFWDYGRLLLEYYGGGKRDESRKKTQKGKIPGGAPRERLALVGALRWGETFFDEVEQRFSWTLYDEEGRQLFVSLKYTKEERLTITLLERLEQRLRSRSYGSIVFFGALYLKEGRLCLYPIEFFLQEEDTLRPQKEDALGEHASCCQEADQMVPDRQALLVMEQYLKEAERQMADVFVSGLYSVSDEMATRLLECAKEGERLGLHGAGRELGLMGKLLLEKRHQMEFSPEPVVEAMCRLERYLLACREKLAYDQALAAMWGRNTLPHLEKSPVS